MTANSTAAMGRSVMRTVLWNDLLRTSRRASRYEYWWGFVQVTVMLIAALLLAKAAHLHLQDPYTVPAVSLFAVIVLFSIVAGFTLHVRRLHDLGMNWWWAAIMYAISLASGIYDEYIGELRLDRFLLASWEGGPFDGAMSLTWLDGLGNGVGLMLFIMCGFFVGDDGANEWGRGPAQWLHRRVRATGRRDEHAVDESLEEDYSPWSRGDERDGE